MVAPQYGITGYEEDKHFMAETLNATCAICGKKYHACNTCSSIKTFKPWRTITDSIDCYKIYQIVYDYTNKIIDKDKAKELLGDCVMPDTFQLHIKKVIKEIMNVDKVKKTTSKKTSITVEETKDNEQ